MNFQPSSFSVRILAQKLFIFPQRDSIPQRWCTAEPIHLAAYYKFNIGLQAYYRFNIGLQAYYRFNIGL
jgi:hypothetical protein